MEPFSFLAHLLLAITAGTLVVSLLAYIAYKVREKRKPSPSKKYFLSDTDASPVFLRLYAPEEEQELPRHTASDH